MSHQTSIWGRSHYKLRQTEDWLEFLSLLGLWIAALVLFTVNLGNLPLRDWDEGTVAQVAKEISLAGFFDWQWLFPKIWGSPYLNKPPLLHDLIALLNDFAGVNEWTARLPGAFLSASSVPLLYLLGRELVPKRLTALFSSLIYLTLLPVVRHGRLAMLDGAVLCFEILMLVCLLRSRRDLRWSLGAGLGFSLLCLTKGIMGMLLGGIGFIFLAWDTPRLLSSAYFWFGWSLGSLPGLAWYGLQAIQYGEVFIESIFTQQINRLGQKVENHHGAPWFYLLEILKYSFPWLLFFIYGLRLAWQENRYSWAKFVLVGTGVYFLVVTIMATKLPWYIMPIYPILALAGGAALNDVKNLPLERPYPRFWAVSLGLVGLLMGILGVLLTFNIIFNFLPFPHPILILIAFSLSLTLGMSSLLMSRRSEQFIAVLFWGLYISLLLFVGSPHWIWELNEAFAVKPVAALVKKYVPPQEKVYLVFDYERPSLNFYSGQRVPTISQKELKKYWQETEQPYILITEKLLSEMSLDASRVLGNTSTDWLLISKSKQPI